MEMNLAAVDTPPRPAASVIILRDTAAGLETFLLKRHGASAVLAGAHVFPGGKVDPGDSRDDMLALLDQAPHELARQLNEPQLATVTAAGLFVAALREVLEECGVLFAQGAAASHAREAARQARAQHAFAQVLATQSLRPATALLRPWSRWVTPRLPTVTNQRFDTRFFMAALPHGQQAQHDEAEASDGVWLRPRDALCQYWDDRIALAPPQIMTLAHLSHFTHVQQVLAAASRRAPACIEPEPFDGDDGHRVTCYPGDPRHRLRQRMMPGPTRLVFRNRRFEPPQGFDALFRTAPSADE